MSGIIKAIKSALSSFVDNVKKVLKVGWDKVLEPVLKEIVKVFGIKDQKVIKTQVNSQKIIDEEAEETIKKIFSRLAIKHKKNPDTNIVDELVKINIEGKTKFDKTYKSAEPIAQNITNYPVCKMKTIDKDEDKVKSVIDSIYNINCKISYLDIDEPTKYEWVYFTLQEDPNYNYQAWDNTLTYNSVPYNITDISYNYNSNKYDVEITEVIDPNTKKSVVTKSSKPDVKTIEVDAFTPKLYFVAKYYTTDKNKEKYWLYDESTNKYNLKFEFVETSNLEMLPVATIRSNFSNTIDLPDSPTIEAAQKIYAKKMLEVLGMDLKTLTDEINKNPHIDDVADVFVHFAVNINEKHPLVSKLLFNMFSFVEPGKEGDKHRIIFRSGSMNLAIAWTGMKRENINGKLGDVGYSEHSVSDDGTVILKQQTSPTVYTQITMKKMSNVTFIDRDGQTGTVNTKPTDDNFFIPISYHFVKQFNSIEKIKIINLSLRITQYAAVIEHIKWYRTGAFADFLKVVGVIIVIGGCLFSGCTTASIGYSLLTAAASSFALQYVFEHTSNKYLKALAVVVAISTASTGSISQAGILNEAIQITQMVTKFVNLYTEQELEKIYNEASEYRKEFGEKTKELEEKLKALQGSLLSSSDIVNITQYDPTRYYLSTDINYMMYMARDVQYDFDSLYDYDIIVSGFYDTKLQKTKD